MTRYWTSDLHLGHERICELAQRPFASVDEMNTELVQRWNDTVGRTDDVIVLGDLAMGRFAETLGLVKQLNGFKYLVPGNHDRVHPVYNDRRKHKRLEWAQMYFEAGVEILPCHIAVGLFHNTACQLIVDACHFPYDRDDLGRTEYDEYLPKDRGRWLLHGHTHGRGLPPEERNPVRGRQVDVGVDLWDFRPVSDSQLVCLVQDVTHGTFR